MPGGEDWTHHISIRKKFDPEIIFEINFWAPFIFGLGLVVAVE